MCGGNAREETSESLVIACRARSGAEPYIALVVGGHDELGRLEAQKESAGLPSGSVPCAVVWSPAAAGQSVQLGSSVTYRVDTASRVRGVIYYIACHLTRACI